jgi:hypothetical protein
MHYKQNKKHKNSLFLRVLDLGYMHFPNTNFCFLFYFFYFTAFFWLAIATSDLLL